MAFSTKWERQRRFKINSALFPVKVHYFLFMGALGGVLPFRTIFCKQLGVSATAVGVIFTAVPFIKLIANPIIGAILDYFKRFRLTLTLIMLVVASSHFAMLFVPPRETRKTGELFTLEANISCSLRSSETDRSLTILCPTPIENCFVKSKIKSCSFVCEACLKPSPLPAIGQRSKRSNYNCSTECNSTNLSLLSFDILPKSTGKEISTSKLFGRTQILFTTLSNVGNLTLDHTAVSSCPCNGHLRCLSEDCVHHLSDCDLRCSGNISERKDDVFSSMQFWVLLTLTCISSVSFSSVMFIMDAACYEILNDKPHKYGEQRVWGTAGWGLGALAGGYLNQLVTGSSDDVNYAPGFYLLVAVTLIDLLPLMKIEVWNVKYSFNILGDVGKLLCRWPVLINVIMVYFVGVLSGFIWNYQFWFMEEIGASQLLLGLSQTFECFAAEIPCFLIAGWVIKKVGHWNCMSITFVCFGFRYLCFAYMKNAWLTLPVGLLHGPTFGLFYSSMTMFAKTEAPPGTEATVQALLSVAFEGVGAATGSILGGIGFDSVGSRATFLYAAVISFVLLVVNVIIHLFLIRKRKEAPSSEFGEDTPSDLIPI